MPIFLKIITIIESLISAFSWGLKLEVHSNKFSREKLIEDIANNLSVTLSLIIKINTLRMLFTPILSSSLSPYPVRSFISFLHAASGDDQSIRVLVNMANLSFFFYGFESAIIQ
jgi:hypothetical protein